MPRDGAIIFRDLVGKLDVLNVECDKCGRRGRYHLDRLIERYGIDAKLFAWTDEITADWPAEAFQEALRPMWGAVPGSAEGGVMTAAGVQEPIGRPYVRKAPRRVGGSRIAFCGRTLSRQAGHRKRIHGDRPEKKPNNP